MSVDVTRLLQLRVLLPPFVPVRIVRRAADADNCSDVLLICDVST